MKQLLLFAAFVTASYTTYAQIGIGTTSPDASAALEINSTTQGLLMPKMTNAEMGAIATPAEGLLVYCTDCVHEGETRPGIFGYVSGQWGRLSSVNPTSSELDVVLAEIYEDHAGGSGNANGTAVTIAQLQSLGITPAEIVNPAYIAEYQTAIQSTLVFSNPPTVGEVRNVLLPVNQEIVLLEVLEDSNATGGANNANTTAVTLTQLQSLGLAGINPDKIADYQAAINAATTAFSNPPTTSQVQGIINTVNQGTAEASVLDKIYDDSSGNSDGFLVTLLQYEAIGVQNLDPTLEGDYQTAIQGATLSNPTNLEEVQAVIDATNQTIYSAAVLAKIGNGDEVTAEELGYLGLTAYYPPFIAEYNAQFAGATFSTPATPAEVQAEVDQENADQQAITPYVWSPNTQQIWMDRNLGATQVATSSTDAAAYGDYYQWGRAADGHEDVTSTVAAGPVASGSEGSNFISTNNTPFDWLADQDDSRWQTATEPNNPCPNGYTVPTEAEWEAERLAFDTNDVAGAFASPLKLPVAGRRHDGSGTLGNVGSSGLYWSSTVSGASARVLGFNSNPATMYSFNRAFGVSVRCIKE